MRIYNRDQSAILGARNNWLAKMRAFSSSTKTRASSKGTTQSAPKSKKLQDICVDAVFKSVSKRDSRIRRQNRGESEKSYDYERSRDWRRRRVETHYEAFSEEGENPFTRRERTPESITKEMESFVSDYNMMIRKIGDLSDSVDETYAKS